MEQLGSEDDACETEDHGSGSDGDIEEGLLLSKNSSGESCEAVRDRKTDDLHAAFVLRGEVTRASLSPAARSRYPDLVFKYQSRTNLQIRVITARMITTMYGLTDAGRLFLVHSLSKIVSWDRKREIGFHSGDPKIYGVESGHDNDTGKQIADLAFYMNKAGHASGEHACEERER